MQKAFQNFMLQNQLCTKNDKVLLALSGGIDSIVMCSLFHEGGFKFGIAHCNFQLRGEESDADEDFVKQVADKLHVKLYVKSFDTQNYANENKLSIQEAARDLRYAWFEEIAEQDTFDHIAIAQHSDDQIETFFINLFRGSGTAGLKGMPVKRGKIIRPLLFADRKEIRQYAVENQLQFREDSSNTSDKYLRNKIRHQLLPVLENILPQALQSIEKSLHFLQEDNILFQQLLESKKEEFFTVKGDTLHTPIETILQLKPLNIWLFYLLKDFDFNRQTTNDLCKLLQNDKLINSGKIFYSTSHRGLVDREFLIIQKIQRENKKAIFNIHQTDHEIVEPLPLKFVIEENEKDHVFDSDPSIAYFDADKLKFPLTLRKWKQGDRFKPLGMKGKKLVSDFLIDNKVDRFAKENCWVILSGDKIIWLVGHRSSEDFKVLKASKQTLKIQCVTID